MVDFGMSKRYCDPTRDCKHMSYADGKSLSGTPRYASINNHLGVAPTRRDDLESIGYVLIYFLKGRLPWQGLPAENKQNKYAKILERKRSVSVASLCEGCPPQFADYMVSLMYAHVSRLCDRFASISLFIHPSNQTNILLFLLFVCIIDGVCGRSTLVT